MAKSSKKNPADTPAGSKIDEILSDVSSDPQAGIEAHSAMDQVNHGESETVTQELEAQNTQAPQNQNQNPPPQSGGLKKFDKFQK